MPELIDFEDASLAWNEHRRLILTVRGHKPYSNMRVIITPSYHMDQPEYWQHDVNGELESAVGMPVETPYEQSADVTEQCGTSGVMVVGLNHQDVIEAEPKPEPPPEPVPFPDETVTQKRDRPKSRPAARSPKKAKPTAKRPKASARKAKRSKSSPAARKKPTAKPRQPKRAAPTIGRRAGALAKRLKKIVKKVAKRVGARRRGRR